MNPFTFQFKETPTASESFDFSLIEYNESLNLSVNKSTGRPAVEELQLGTETFTRVTGEATDSDYTGVGLLMATQTATKTHGEGVDSDPSAIGLMIETRTTTFTALEGTDTDK